MTKLTAVGAGPISIPGIELKKRSLRRSKRSTRSAQQGFMKTFSFDLQNVFEKKWNKMKKKTKKID